MMCFQVKKKLEKCGLKDMKRSREITQQLMLNYFKQRVN